MQACDRLGSVLLMRSVAVLFSECVLYLASSPALYRDPLCTAVNPEQLLMSGGRLDHLTSLLTKAGSIKPSRLGIAQLWYRGEMTNSAHQHTAAGLAVVPFGYNVRLAWRATCLAVHTFHRLVV